ncbi:hypothetical protein AnigIFM59636_002934 [Aspergillus niger]|uniref:Uncharacterized protein n=2 Tax=Aspergillus niger TaxID=5061 RepID=A2R277_ASPNC|nr:uncharacterized protein BO96DRAFT_486622 [Aspergillus niger CBS 101883]XP_059602199.1 hypothetical protein An13g03850 [Aspergillus niger]PYH59918.1 hypothetical protein BO96DRAFT_486622 [Aspergillus niger CBS 101883]GKZ90900.1 hypothetical protein AnigIFM59636_002934 [Aspergillus niger]CAK41777.1 hypothetical protein An13g03850 [Aspergillus niger]
MAIGLVVNRDVFRRITECSRWAREDLNAAVQALGRANRTGQNRPQKAWILTQKRSINMFTEARNMVKALPQIAADLHSDLKEILDEDNRRIGSTQAIKKPGTRETRHGQGKPRHISRDHEYSRHWKQ